MSLDVATIDRIVSEVLAELGSTSGERHSSSDARPAAGTNVLAIDDAVITGEMLAERIGSATSIRVRSKAILTPTAQDEIRSRKISVQRIDVQTATRNNSPSGPSNSGLLLVVRSTPAVEQLRAQSTDQWRSELHGCPDDAAARAVNALATAETASVVILAEQTHRAACLANRNRSAKAVAVRDAGDVREVRRQLKANVWCVDPTGRGWFELMNLLKSIRTN